MAGVPDGYLTERGCFMADDRIGESIADNEIEVLEIFRQNTHRIQRVRCAWCDKQTHTTERAAVRWFHNHLCENEDEAEIVEIHDSLTCCDILEEAA